VKSFPIVRLERGTKRSNIVGTAGPFTVAGWCGLKLIALDLDQTVLPQHADRAVPMAVTWRQAEEFG
jgi:hypothetical protein